MMTARLGTDLRGELGPGAVAVGAAALAGAVVAAMPSTAFQLALVIGLAACVLAVVLARQGTLLNPVLVLVGVLYLVGPIGTLVREAGLGLSTLVLMIGVATPFVLAAAARSSTVLGSLPALAPLAGLVLLAAASLAWSEDPAYGLQKLSVWIIGGLVPAGFVFVLRVVIGGVSWPALLVVAGASAVALIVFGGTTPEYPDRVTLFGDNPIWTARAAFIGALVALFGPFPRTVRALAVPVLLVAGLLTVSLGPLLGFVVGTWTGAVVAIRSPERRAGPRQAGWITLGFVTGVAILVLFADAVFGGDRSLLGRAILADPNVVGRTILLDTAISQFVESPVQGVGLGGFAARGILEYPHNLVAEVAAELGVVGLAMLLSWAALAVRGAAGSPLLGALLAATGVYALFSGSVASNAEFWMISALAVASTARRAAPGSARTAAPNAPGRPASAGVAQ